MGYGVLYGFNKVKPGPKPTALFPFCRFSYVLLAVDSRSLFVSPHDEVSLVNVPSTFAVPEDTAVAHHSTLLQGFQRGGLEETRNDFVSRQPVVQIHKTSIHFL